MKKQNKKYINKLKLYYFIKVIIIYGFLFK